MIIKYLIQAFKKESKTIKKKSIISVDELKKDRNEKLKKNWNFYSIKEQIKVLKIVNDYSDHFVFSFGNLLLELNAVEKIMMRGFNIIDKIINNWTKNK